MKNIYNNKGMSIIELMVSVVILAVGILAMAGVVPMAVRSINKSKLMTTATDYSQQQMEILKKSGFNSLPVGAHTEDYYHPSGDDRYWQWWSVTADVNGNTNIRRVDVSTSWDRYYTEHPAPEQTDHPREWETVTVTSYFSR